MLLSRAEILGWLKPVQGPPLIVIEPFDPERLGPNTYDVSLGPWFYRTQLPSLGTRVYNPYCEDGVRALWGEPRQAVSAEAEFGNHGMRLLEGVDPEDRIIMVHPLETILCHTEEFVGGLKCVAGWMQGKSGWSRSFISVCIEVRQQAFNIHNHSACDIVLLSKNGLAPLAVTL